MWRSDSGIRVCKWEQVWAKYSALQDTRISEHLGISPLNGKKLTCSSLSAIQAHIRITCQPTSFEDFSIMSYCNSSSELLIKESLHISKFAPELNETISLLFLIYISFLINVSCPNTFLLFSLTLCFCPANRW